MIRLELSSRNLDVNFVSNDEDEDDLDVLSTIRDLLETLRYRDNVYLVIKSKEDTDEAVHGDEELIEQFLIKSREIKLKMIK